MFYFISKEILLLIDEIVKNLSLFLVVFVVKKMLFLLFFDHPPI